jgi:lipopolysaccharide transport system ATP-binding protein
MSSESIAIRIEGLSKAYRMYDKPVHRLLQFLLPRVGGLFSRAPREYYRQFNALNGVSFEVAKGETFAIVGRNGSGKSTLLQLICGTLAPSSGEVRVVGKVAALLELGAGFNPEFTGRENVFLNGAVFGIDRATMQARFDDIVAFADIGDFIDQPLKTYSSGMAVRLAFAVAIHVDAEIMIIDEALSVGDFAFQAKCMRKLKEFVAAGGTLLFVSHDIVAVKSLCRRALYLREGRIRACGPSEEVCEQYLTETNISEGLASAEGTAIAAGAGRDGDGVAGKPGMQAVEAFRKAVEPFRRHGSAACEFVGAALLDAGGNPVSSVEWGRAIQVRAILSVREPIANLVVAFYLRDRMQVDVLGTNTEYENIALHDLRAGETISVTFGFRNWLRAGEYGVCLIAADTSITTNQYYDWIDLAAVVRTADRPGHVAWALTNPGIAVNASREVD